MSTSIISPFTRENTADEVSAGIDLTGRRAIVTGGASGIGVETVRTLARRGAEVTIAARRLDAATRIAEDIKADTGHPNVHAAELELTDRASVAAFADAWTGPLDLLINNAGVMMIQELTRNADGREMQFATNHLGHFDLTTRLHAALAAAPDGARVVNVSSSGHLFGPVVFDDIDYRFRVYDPLSAYAQSKTAGILFAVGATQRWAGDGILVNAVNPGAIRTGLQRHIGGKLATPQDQQKDVHQGAATSIFAAVSPLLEGIGGRYFNDNTEAVPVDKRPADARVLVTTVARYALDPEAADRLWTASEQYLS
ncbi:NAD(P)-dependent dehydrogenase, short-chain alcohol dehydrogenase family [Micromonospora haikouensis]|uniref:NAD(P)-dependent dehydrogenase, short-chain alcohol dehydrogenase family n=1 Tax=Micromonospora haikouensis TaxID=686309 RepID=A0A1C4XFS1_9ACTN|nr:SDR family NAD(P)-dependent oxidoreductase [Micromonospora haikouensis]SCF07323.1 NAD(P)-dependent dehydrogenase, short-chain alcohol dehydrogenase family [Micromonospora haikouensis]